MRFRRKMQRRKCISGHSVLFFARIRQNNSPVGGEFHERRKDQRLIDHQHQLREHEQRQVFGSTRRKRFRVSLRDTMKNESQSVPWETMSHASRGKRAPTNGQNQNLDNTERHDSNVQFKTEENTVFVYLQIAHNHCMSLTYVSRLRVTAVTVKVVVTQPGLPYATQAYTV